MKITSIRSVCFSPTRSTRKIAGQIAGHFAPVPLRETDITENALTDEIHMGYDELLIVGVPVYAGRIPALAANSIRHIKGEATPAILFCTYGNRDYDDALLELKELVEQNGFKPVSAAAFIAQHSIFPTLAANRPDTSDRQQIDRFATESRKLLEQIESAESLSDIPVKGNHPYKVAKAIPLIPRSGRRCNRCGACARLCPTHAIDPDNPRKTDKDKCISCAHCIALCPQQARHFGGILYRIATHKFVAAHSDRKEPDLLFAPPEK